MLPLGDDDDDDDDGGDDDDRERHSRAESMHNTSNKRDERHAKGTG